MHCRGIIAVLLAGLLTVSTCPVSGLAQEDSLGPVSSSADSDNTKDDVLVGFVVVVLGILIWLGIKSDWDRRQRSEVQESIEEYARAGELPSVGVSMEEWFSTTAPGNISARSR